MALWADRPHKRFLIHVNGGECLQDAILESALPNEGFLGERLRETKPFVLFRMTAFRHFFGNPIERLDYG